jgi:3-oxo-5alpha-steroid 4-dehydrogenase
VVDPRAMESIVQVYNEIITDKKPDLVGKLEYKSVITMKPIYGIDISLKRTKLMLSPAMGLRGLRVNGVSGLVLNDRGDNLHGVYVAEKNAAGVSSQNCILGLALADCVFSGLRAGERASKDGRALASQV